MLNTEKTEGLEEHYYHLHVYMFHYCVHVTTYRHTFTSDVRHSSLHIHRPVAWEQLDRKTSFRHIL